MVIKNERREMSNGQRNRTEPYLLYGLHGLDAAACGWCSIHDTD